MISPYLARLLCLSLASFFLAYLALGLASMAAAPSAVRWGKRIRPRAATWLLLSLRLGPLALALFIVLGMCLPSYLLFEPHARAEGIGLACLVAAVAGAATWAISIGRALGALAGTFADLRRYFRQGSETISERGSLPVQVMESETPVLALAGVLRPRIVVSRGIVRVLSPEQLQAALRHEGAHWAARDNLKRLLLLLAPDPFPFFRGLRRLDRAWAKFAEWAADDWAVDGDSQRSLSLAAALVRVARMGTPARRAPLMATLATGEADDLSARVDRLLCPEPVRDHASGFVRVMTGGAAVVAAALLIAIVVQPATLDYVHRVLELLIH